MMKVFVATNIYVGYNNVGSTLSVLVTHLQFADDTLILDVKSWTNVRAMRAVLILYEAMSGLKLNFHKSMLVNVNISDSYEGAFCAYGYLYRR